MIKKMLFSAFAACFMMTTPALAEWPERPIELIIPFGAGGGADIEGRLLAKGMSEVLGQPVVAVNKPGGGGAITYSYVKNAKPDGYTLAWSSTSILTATNIGNLPFEYTALDHLGQVEYQPIPFVVKADSRWKTFEEFAEECRANPNTLKIAFAGFGGTTHLFAVALTKAAGCEAVMLPVKAQERNTKLLSGEVDAVVHIFIAPLKLVKAKKLRFLALSSGTRNPAVPDVPTAKELGYDIELDLFRGLAAPTGMPEDVKQKIEAAMIKAASSDEFRSRAEKLSFTLAPLGHKAFGVKLAKDNDYIAQVMKDAGIYRSKSKD